MPTKIEILEALTHDELKALCNKFEIPLRKEVFSFTKTLTKRDEIIEEILEHTHPTKKEILAFTEQSAKEKKVKRKRKKAVKCPNCGSTNVELREIITEGQTGWRASLSLPVSVERKSEKMQGTAIYLCRDCNETFKRDVQRA